MYSMDFEINRGIKKYTGQLVLAGDHLYFLCEQKSGFMAQIIGESIGHGVGGVLGAAARAAGEIASDRSAQNLAATDASDADLEISKLDEMVAENPHSFKAKSSDVEYMKRGWMTSTMKVNGEKMAVLKPGFEKEHHPALTAWCLRNGVTHKGFG
jgi:hypothetical protein